MGLNRAFLFTFVHFVSVHFCTKEQGRSRNKNRTTHQTKDFKQDFIVEVQGTPKSNSISRYRYRLLHVFFAVALHRMLATTSRKSV